MSGASSIRRCTGTSARLSGHEPENDMTAVSCRKTIIFVSSSRLAYAPFSVKNGKATVPKDTSWNRAPSAMTGSARGPEMSMVPVVVPLIGVESCVMTPRSARDTLSARSDTFTGRVFGRSACSTTTPPSPLCAASESSRVPPLSKTTVAGDARLH